MNKLYSELAVRSMIAEGVYKFIKKIDFNKISFPRLIETVDEVIKEYDDEHK